MLIEPVRFFVEGKPATKGSYRAYTYKRKGGDGFGARVDHDNKQTRAWAKKTEAVALEAMDGRPPFSEAVAVRVIFSLARPKKHYRANGRLRDDAPRFHAVKPDIDKVERAIYDGMTSVVYDDDARIVAGPSIKLWAPEGCRQGVAVCAQPMTEEVLEFYERLLIEEERFSD